MEPAERIEDKLTQCRKAISGLLQLMNKDFGLVKDEILADALDNAKIQKFEVAVEIFWKTVKFYLNSKHNYNIRYSSEAFKELYLKRIINENEYDTLIECVKMRNILSHEYNLEKFAEALKSIQKYAPTLTDTFLKFEQAIDKLI